MNRRTFVQASLATAALTSLPVKVLAAEDHKIEKIGMQLYTVRDAMKADFAGTIAKVAGIGYKELEFAGYYDHTPKDVRAILDKNKVTAPSCHVSMDIVTQKWAETIEAAKVIGQEYIVCPYIPDAMRKTADGWKQIVDTFNKAGAESKKHGITFGYHNHYWEFEPDKTLGGKFPYDYLLDSTDKDLVKMELDLCWISVAGQDPVKYFDKYPGRFPLVHVKDMKKLPPVKDGVVDMKEAVIEEEMTSVGNGVIDWKRIFEHAKKGGVKHYFVENDVQVKPFESLTASYGYLEKLRF